MKASRPKDDLIIIRVDGGICSQIGFVSLGLHLEQKGYRVKYDLSWYEVCGKDDDGKFVRNFDFPKAFPGIQIAVASREEVERYAWKYSRFTTRRESFRPPLYIDCYPERTTSFCDLCERLKEQFRPELDPEVRAIAQVIASDEDACAVHVRRGDLAKRHIGYGEPTRADYFGLAVDFVRAADPRARFYFFSDEPDWVRENILPLVSGATCSVVDLNGSDRGYVDLFLMMQARYFITSQGSLGLYAAQLAKKTAKMVVCSRYLKWINGLPCPVVTVNDSLSDEYVEDERKFALREFEWGRPSGWRRFVKRLGFGRNVEISGRT